MFKPRKLKYYKSVVLGKSVNLIEKTIDAFKLTYLNKTWKKNEKNIKEFLKTNSVSIYSLIINYYINFCSIKKYYFLDIHYFPDRLICRVIMHHLYRV